MSTKHANNFLNQIKKVGLTKLPSLVFQDVAFGEVKASILEMNLESTTYFTFYPEESSPIHPLWPVPDQLCEARMLDYSISYARTVAGLHHPSDNIAGLMIGQDILCNRLTLRIFK